MRSRPCSRCAPSGARERGRDRRCGDPPSWVKRTRARVGYGLEVGKAFAVAFALGATAASASAGGADRPALAGAQPCAEAPGFTCSTLTVQLDRSGEVPGRLGLQVAVRTGGGSLGTLLFLTGGPGQPGVPVASFVSGRLSRLFAGYRVVFFDQRGTGANALRCPALQRQMGSSDLAVPT